MPPFPNSAYHKCGSTQTRTTTAVKRYERVLSFAEGTQMNAVPVLADGQRRGGIHTGGLRRGLDGAGASGSRAPRLRGQHPEWTVIAKDSICVHDHVGQLILVITIAPPDDHPVDGGIIILVDQILTGQLLDLGADGVIHVGVPQPLLDDVPSVEPELFSVIRCRLIHETHITKTLGTAALIVAWRVARYGTRCFRIRCIDGFWKTHHRYWSLARQRYFVIRAHVSS